MIHHRFRLTFKQWEMNRIYSQKRFIDLSKQANRKGIVIYSDFLNLSEQNLLSVTKGKLETSYELSGGHEYAEERSRDSAGRFRL